MNVWNILGIAPTSDMEAIKTAYHAKLAVTHPEEKPEEFKELRAAYDEAVRLAKQVEDADGPAPGEGGPLEAWGREAEAIYNDFARRADPAQWEQLLQAEVCVSLVGRVQARDRLMRFFMDEYYLPHTVWKMLDAFFELQANEEELKEIFPPAFIDRVVLPGIQNSDYVKYEWFNECHGTEPDDYLHQFFKVEGHLRENELEQAEEALNTLRAMPAKHPFTEMLGTRLLLRKGQGQAALELAVQTLALQPQSDTLLLAAGGAARAAEAWEQGLGYYQAVLDQDAGINAALFGKASCLSSLEKWEDAADTFGKLLEKFPTDRSLQDKQQQAYKNWAVQLERSLAENPVNNRARLDLAWCCLEEGNFQKGLDLLADFEPQGYGERYEHQNTCGNLSLALGNCEQALEYAKGWEAAMLAIPEDTEDEELKAKRGRVSRSYEMQAAALKGLDRMDEALARLDDARAISPSEPRIYRSLCQWMLEQKKFEDVFEPAKKLSELLPGDAIGPYYLGLAQFENLDYRESYDRFEEALRRDGTNLDFYLYKARVLMIYKKEEEARELMEFLAKSGVDCDATVFLNARMLQLFSDEEAIQQKAHAIYKTLLDKPDLDMGFTEQLYFAASFNEELSRQQQLDLAEKGLALRPYDFDLLGRVTWLSNEVGKYQRAIQIGEESLQRYPGVINQMYRLAHAYMQTNQHEKGAALYEQTGERENDQEDFYFAGRGYYLAGMYEKARACLERCLSMNADNAYALRYLSLLCRDEGQLEAALEAARKAPQVEEEKDKMKFHWRHLARMLEHAGLLDEAFEARMNAARLFEDLDSYIDADDVWENAQRWDKAFTARQKYFSEHRTKEDQDLYWMELAWLCFKQGDFAAVKKHLGHVSRRTKAEEYNMAWAYYFLALNEPKKAYEWWCKIPMDKTHQRQSPPFLFMLQEQGRTAEFNALLTEKKERVAGWDNEGQQLLCMVVKASLLGFEGKFDEAWALLGDSEKKPLCEHCYSPQCKDRIIVQAQLLEQQGQYQKALELLQQAYRISAADSDIVVSILRVKRRMK